MTAQTDRLNTALAGRYRIERHLGEGGMATVYLCEDLKHALARWQRFTARGGVAHASGAGDQLAGCRFVVCLPRGVERRGDHARHLRHEWRSESRVVARRTRTVLPKYQGDDHRCRDHHGFGEPDRRVAHVVRCVAVLLRLQRTRAE